MDRKQRVVHSLRRVEGQLRGIEKMIEEGRPCDEILDQLVAVHAAVGRIGTDVILREASCRAAADASSDRELERLKKLLVTYSALK